MYRKITEHCGWEGETWHTFILERGNEEFLQDLKNAIDKYPDLKGGDNYIELHNNQVAEADIDVLLKHGDSGYFDQFNKFEGTIDSSKIDDSSGEAFVESFYKRQWFR